MFNKVKEFFSSKSKWFKILLIIAFIAVVIAAKVIDENKSDNDKSPSASASSENTSAKEQPGIHIGIGHIVMIVVFTAAYGIDKIIVYRNKLEDEQKYNNHKEK